ncbi:unnamed protein product [Staurois parvus]|uniref:Uncharacterized protein n=1 Tax=Staurois parvus TaxID=386267 RepID=A0ABN9FMZ4_9NEOB|nr:unnamed protein product [Staurois parvus]
MWAARRSCDPSGSRTAAARTASSTWWTRWTLTGWRKRRPSCTR